jgi:hypothetical protein
MNGLREQQTIHPFEAESVNCDGKYSRRGRHDQGRFTGVTTTRASAVPPNRAVTVTVRASPTLAACIETVPSSSPA